MAAISAVVLHFTRITTEIAVLWPTNGLVLGWCLLRPAARAPALIAAGFVGNVMASMLLRDDLLIGVGFALANTVEIALAWRALRPAIALHQQLGHPAVLTRFAWAAVLVAPAVSGILAAGLSWTVDASISWQDVFRHWWAADALGMALFATTVVALHPSQWKESVCPVHWRVMLAPIGTLVAVVLSIFYLMPVPLLFLAFPALLWNVFRGGLPGACLASLVLLAMAFPMTYAGMGPISLLKEEISLVDRFFVLQLFMGIALLSAFPVGVLLDHRDRLLGRLQRRENDLMELAVNDPLTGLLNRRGLEGHLEHWQACRHPAEPLGWVIFDIDHFKRYNDAFGHAQGDTCLLKVARIIHQHAAAVGGAAVRHGGEEFVAVLPGFGQRRARLWAETVRRAVETLALPSGSTTAPNVVTVSAGVASCKVACSPAAIASLAQEADVALYHAKHAGRNRVYGAEQ